MKETALSAVLASALALATVGDAHAGSSVSTPPAGGGGGSSSGEAIVAAAFLIAVGTLLFGQGFGQKQQKVTKKSKNSEY